ncbi:MULTISPECIES: protein kinase domain-containing protein [unclassified Microcoleus]|uniref:protein kinase domain-containing protein n=1 Tax=unclassified Microcoleus TaxID=2642155 RepID=UPI002FD0EFD7
MDVITHLPGYQIAEQIYAGSRTLVYRGVRESDRTPVVIKLLRNEYPNFNELVGFRNQYTIAKNLNFPSIIHPLTLEVYQNSYALVMEDFGGISLSNYLHIANDKNQPAKSLSLTEFLKLALQLTDILHYLYQNRVIHKDIKPANILIHPQTKQIKLIDFSIASLLPRETQEIKNPNVLEGTLAYLSPEQTGRMNRGIDYRSDFYSLGVTFYELLTGELPFVSEDAMELVHCHLAKQAIPIHQLHPEIPLVLSHIVSKLMAKNAENRYQSALGLKYDLEKCLTQVQETGQIESFELGDGDISDRFIIPDQLYGREREVETLLQAFERVANPPKSPLGKGGLRGVEMMLVAGFSGIGKTAVINEVHKPIVRQRGYFIKGKYDQFQRNIPLSAFVQAFRDLMGQLRAELDLPLQTWKTKILTAVGDNGQVLIDVIPELEYIIGKQQIAPELSGSAAQNRFNLLMQKFVQVFTQAEHPLVMFLDDLQWADSASLKLLQLLMEDTGHLLVLGAYRDNEVSPVHQLILTVDEIIKSGVTVNRITLQPLSQSDLNQLVADTLNCQRLLAQTLTKLVYQKTKGNPFFATQFLKALHDDLLITFDWDIRHWQCDLARVRTLAITDDVVEFMALQLQKLPRETQDVLKLAACIGAQFDLDTLAIVSEKSAEVAATALWKSLQEGLIIPTTEIYKFFTQSDTASVSHAAANPTYRFLHDRVQQAAYFLIPDDQKQTTHLKIGQLLLHSSSSVEPEEKLFDIVRHLNQGIELIAQPQEREALAKLNLKAGHKARNSTAYNAARVYLQTGIEILTANCWQDQYELTLNLHVGATEAAYLNADFDGMEKIAALVLQKAETILDKIQIYQIQIVAYTAQSKILEAIAVGRDALFQLGVELPTAPDEAKIAKALQTVASLQGDRGIEELVDLPVMSDRQTQAAMQLLGLLFSPILQGMPGLMPILSATMVSLSIQFGNTPGSTVGYAIHSMVLCAFVGEVKSGYSFGRLAINLVDQLNVREFESKVLLLFAAWVQHHQESLRATMLTMKDGYATGMETGDFLNAGYNSLDYLIAKLFAGVELDTWEPEIATYRAVLVQIKQHSAQTFLDMMQQTVQNLREGRILSDCLIGSAYDETVMLSKHHQDKDLTAIAIAYTYKLMLAYFFGNYTTALDYNTQAKEYLMAVSGMIFIPIFHFYTALTHLALLSTHPESEQGEFLSLAQTHQTTLQQWAQNAPMNHLHKWYLVEAEKYRVLGNKAEAIEHYDRAISGAKANEYIQEEALANELAAKFYLHWGKQEIAQAYMTNAYYGYARWGAKAKVTDLERRYPQLLAPILQQTRSPLSPHETIFTLGSVTSTSSPTSSSSSISVALDLAAILKASQTLSGEIELEKLLSKLLDIVIKNAGADWCVFMLLESGRLLIQALARLSQSGGNNQTAQVDFYPMLLNPQPVEDSIDVPVSLINTVKRSLQPAVIIDATVHPKLSNDPYIQQQQPKSILCSPILHQGKLLGILYLENNLATGAFTSERVELLNLLCTQAAISLQNARLYAREQEKSQDLEQALTNLQNAQIQLIQGEKMSALGNLVAGVAHEINNPVGFLSGNIQPALDYIKDLFGLLDLFQQEYPNYSAAIQEEIETIELDYIREDLPKLVGSMRQGVKRIQDISISLRTFSRADSDRPVACNIHDGIDSTIMILKHRLKANDTRPEIQVIKDYGALQNIECYAGQLNQVFMNILGNAIDALDESNIGRSYAEIKANPNQIIVKTELSTEQKHVIIRIKDNAIGMTEAVREKVFDNLFTTKAVGKGTGLGLAIARQIIVEKHGGSLNVNSILGKGTEFIITLPTKA